MCPVPSVLATLPKQAHGHPGARRIAASLLALGGAAMLAGCGGGGSSSASPSTALCQAASAGSALIGVAMAWRALGAATALRAAGSSTSAAPLAQAFAASSLPTSTSSPTSVIRSYAPWQVRDAYDEIALPASWGSLNAAQRAQMGAGQTVYIIDPYDDPELAAELQAFDTRFGLPSCTSESIPPSASLPLSAASASAGCTLSVVYTNATAAMSSSAPAYSSFWSGQTALQTEWAHATAPLARLLVVETPDSGSSLSQAVSLVDTMGPGVVSIDWGQTETSSQSDAMFGTTGMSYVAGTGSGGGGQAPLWPAVAPEVLAAGGTSLISYASAPRDEIAWTDAGSGTSQYTALPAFQSSVPGVGSTRAVADVSMNADANTGELYDTILPGSTASPTWYNAGGTGLAACQWAGIIAVADALREFNGEAALGSVAPLLYPLLSDASRYAQGFNDIIAGSDGSCASCSAGPGYDQPSGLGTPKVAGLLGLLTAGTGVSPPHVSPVTVTSSNHQSLQFSMAVAASRPVSWALSHAPAGMSIDSASGTITWYQPVAGWYAVDAMAIDPSTGLTGGATATIDVVAAGPAPTVQAATLSATPAQPLYYGLQVTDPNQDALRYTLSGAPSGMSIDSSGRLSWASPVLGSYTPTATVTDTVSGLSASATITVQVSTVPGPVLTGTSLSTSATGSLQAVIASLADSGTTQAQLSIAGAAPGMRFETSGSKLLLDWPDPSCGVYNLTITATDAAGLSTQTQVSVQIG